MRETWHSFTASLYLGDDPVPRWTGVVEYSERGSTRMLEAAARELVEMLLSGESQPMDYVIL